MGDINFAAVITIVACSGVIAMMVLSSIVINNLQRTIDRQQDTIQRLINREPVTYQEVGANPQKPSKEVYAAWGAQMVNIDEDESRQ